MHASDRTRNLRRWAAVIVPAVVVGIWASSSMAGHDPVCEAVTIVLTELGTLEFGSVAGDGSSSGTVIINPDTGAKTVTGGAVDFGGTPSAAASWQIAGSKQCTVILTFPASITVTSGGDTTTVDTFNPDLTNPILIPNSGKITFKVGATLNVGVNQAAGTYTGTFNVNVIYE